MANSKSTLQDTNRQGFIKEFDSGVVSWSLFSEAWNIQDALIEKVRRLLDVGDFDSCGWEVNILFDLLEKTISQIF